MNKLAELRQAVILLGDQLEILKEQMKLKCGRNVSSYCTTLLRFNESKYDWDKVKMHLMGHPNSSQMVYDLQKEIRETFTKKLSDMLWKVLQIP